MTDVQIAVGLGWKTRGDLLIFALFEIALNDLLEEVQWLVFISHKGGLVGDFGFRFGHKARIIAGSLAAEPRPN